MQKTAGFIKVAQYEVNSLPAQTKVLTMIKKSLFIILCFWSYHTSYAMDNPLNTPEWAWEFHGKNISLTAFAIELIEREKYSPKSREKDLAECARTLAETESQITGKKTDKLRTSLTQALLIRKAELEAASCDPRLYKKHHPLTLTLGPLWPFSI